MYRFLKRPVKGDEPGRCQFSLLGKREDETGGRVRVTQHNAWLQALVLSYSSSH